MIWTTIQMLAAAVAAIPVDKISVSKCLPPLNVRLAWHVRLMSTVTGVTMPGSDFGFVGQAYAPANSNQDVQRLVNWYLEVSGDGKSKMPTALLGRPGLDPIIQLDIAAVRGFWVLPGGLQAIAVAGETVYVITTTVPATQTSIAQFATRAVGYLTTNSGQVRIRDNGAGGYAVLVDGQNGYYFRIAGAGTTTFTGTPTSGSFTLPYSGSLNTALVTGSAINGTGIAVGTVITSINVDAGTVTMSAAATSSPGPVTITVTLNEFDVISDPGFVSPSHIAFIDGWFIVNRVGSQAFATSGPVAYTLIFPVLFFALKDSQSDNLQGLEELNREVWLIGERASEIWFNAGGANFAFQRIPGAAPPIGTSAPQSIRKSGDSLMWLGRTQEGENVVVQTQQYSWKRVSQHGVETQITSYPLVADASAYSYEEEGHLFYVLTFPTADRTWVYDNNGTWHERLSYDTTTGQYHRERPNCFANFQNLRLVGDYQSGQIHHMSREFYTDAGQPIVCLRRCPHVWSAEDRKRRFSTALQIEFKAGVGSQTGQGVNPQMMLRWSSDSGQSFGNEHWAGIGRAGQTKHRAIWRRLGSYWDRVYEGRFSDPAQRDIVGATLYQLPSETGNA